MRERPGGRKKIYEYKMGDSGIVVTVWINGVLNSGGYSCRHYGARWIVRAVWLILYVMRTVTKDVSQKYTPAVMLPRLCCHERI
ncbi:hypothetical protein TURU_107412 [Turdus rufiventris]|nr:hypothetical protein TURU_107412 [Turdus rufiventris]